uniref:CARD domain-containing protein n=1 Tax=Sinocyclocheilus rhinocerous TaxID=307959 RepID=A0A673IDC4_9TELE
MLSNNLAKAAVFLSNICMQYRLHFFMQFVNVQPTLFYVIPKTWTIIVVRYEVFVCLFLVYVCSSYSLCVSFELIDRTVQWLFMKMRQHFVHPGAEFVEKHRTELIRRVSLVEPIADDMKPLLGDEKYGIILQYKGVTQAQMRALLDFLTTPKLKDKLYQSLLEREGVLVEYLEGSG